MVKVLKGHINKEDVCEFCCTAIAAMVVGGGKKMINIKNILIFTYKNKEENNGMDVESIEMIVKALKTHITNIMVCQSNIQTLYFIISVDSKSTTFFK